MHSVIGMLSSGFGHVINISSIMGKFSTGRKTSYSGAKFGLNGMMDSLRCEVCAHTLNLWFNYWKSFYDRRKGVIK